jgi:hypothetical protein
MRIEWNASGFGPKLGRLKSFRGAVNKETGLWLLIHLYTTGSCTGVTSWSLHEDCHGGGTRVMVFAPLYPVTCAKERMGRDERGRDKRSPFIETHDRASTHSAHINLHSYTLLFIKSTYVAEDNCVNSSDHINLKLISRSWSPGSFWSG